MINNSNNNFGYLYKIINPKGKIYIGQTKNLKRRFQEYKSLNCENQRILFHSLKKYGFDSHAVEVFCKCNCDILNKLEIYFIKYYNSYHKYNKLGMNLTPGGTLNESRKGVKFTDAHRKKLSLAKIGKSKWNIGKKRTPEQLLNWKTVKVNQYSLTNIFIKTWNSIMEASRELGIGHTNITACCKKKKWRKSAGGFIWEYLDTKK